DFGEEVVFVIHEGAAFRTQLGAQYAIHGVTTRHAGYPRLPIGLMSLVGRLERERPSLILCEVRREPQSALELLAALGRSSLAEVPVLIVTEERNAALGLAALEAGAADFVSAPAGPREIVLRARVHLKQAARMRALARLAHVDELTGLF